jgi:hypothetical protein
MATLRGHTGHELQCPVDRCDEVDFGDLAEQFQWINHHLATLLIEAHGQAVPRQPGGGHADVHHPVLLVQLVINRAPKFLGRHVPDKRMRHLAVRRLVEVPRPGRDGLTPVHQGQAANLPVR